MKLKNEKNWNVSGKNFGHESRGIFLNLKNCFFLSFKPWLIKAIYGKSKVNLSELD